MAFITKQEVADLAKMREKYCVSMFVPTSRHGEAVKKGKDRTGLKNQIKEVSVKLAGHGLKEREIRELTEPAHRLLEDGSFWGQQMDGLAVYLTTDYAKVFKLPLELEATNYVGEDFYLKPLLPMFAGDGSFLLLAIALDKVELFECSRHQVTRIRIKDRIPKRMEETVGFDYEDKGLQFRNQREGFGEVIYHGHAEADRDVKDEIRRYFREVNKGLMQILHDQEAPMLVICQDYLFPIYREVNTYTNLVEKNVPRDVSHLSAKQLHQIGWKQMGAFFDREREDRIDSYKRFEGTQRTATAVEDILEAARNGTVDTLFCLERADVWGRFDLTTGEVIQVDSPAENTFSLINEAAVQVFLQGGKVYFLKDSEMPYGGSGMNALLRF